MRQAVALAAALLFLAGGRGPAAAGDKADPGRPRLDLRASPRIAFPPVNVLLVAELRGGTAVEDFYCPGLEWDWGDGSRSAQEGDCPPFEEGATLQRLFTAWHAYGVPGTYEVRLTLRRASRKVAVARVPVVVYGGGGDSE